jgi:hypothetical protein
LAPDYAFGFELADVRRLQSRSSANANALTVAGFLDRGRETGLVTDGRSMVTVWATFVPVAFAAG